MDRKTLITFLLDRTGSMGQIKQATIKAFNGYLDGLRGEFEGRTDELIEFTLLQFDSISLETICIAEPVKRVAYPDRCQLPASRFHTPDRRVRQDNSSSREIAGGSPRRS